MLIIIRGDLLRRKAALILLIHMHGQLKQMVLLSSAVAGVPTVVYSLLLLKNNVHGAVCGTVDGVMRKWSVEFGGAGWSLYEGPAGCRTKERDSGEDVMGRMTDNRRVPSPNNT